MNTRMNALFLAAAVGALGLPATTGLPTLSDPAHDLSDVQATAINSFDYLGKDWDSFTRIFADDATVKCCWGGDGADCTEGSPEDVLLPFHRAIKVFKSTTRRLTGAGNRNGTFSTQWHNYIETPLGCGEVTMGYSLWELNDEGKVVRLISLTDNGLNCVPQYHEATKTAQEL